MDVYPIDPAPQFSFIDEMEFRTDITNFSSGKEHRNSLDRFPKRSWNCVYTGKKDVIDLFWQFYKARRGQWEDFWFFDFDDSNHTDEFIAQGDGITSVFDLSRLANYSMLSINPCKFDSWTKLNVTVTPNVVNAPTGFMTMDKIIPTNVNDNHKIHQYIANAPNNTVLTWSVYIKAGEITTVIVSLITKAGNSPRVTVNLTNGTLSNGVGTGYISSTISAIGNGIYKVDLKVNTSAGAFTCSAGIWPNVWGVSQGNGADGFYIWGGLVSLTDLPPYHTLFSDLIIRVDGAVTPVGLLLGGGQGGADRIQFDTAPAMGSLITADFSGKLRLRSRFKEPKMSKERFDFVARRTGLSGVEIR